MKQNEKKTSFQIIEDRGCGIRYSMGEGTYNECLEWLENNCTFTDDRWVSLDEANGNGEPFTYEIVNL